MEEESTRFKYPKIQTLWKRDENRRHVIMPGHYTLPEFENQLKWLVTEKIHGVNIRVIYEVGKDGKDEVTIGGRSDNAQLNPKLLAYLQKTFTEAVMKPNFEDIKTVVLYGEGYGQKINKGGRYIMDDVSFILFDIFIDGWWLKREDVEDIANKLNISVVPSLGIMEIPEIVDIVQIETTSKVSEDKTLVAEGVVVKSHPLVLLRSGNPLMWKLKVRDFKQLKKQQEYEAQQTKKVEE